MSIYKWKSRRFMQHFCNSRYKKLCCNLSPIRSTPKLVTPPSLPQICHPRVGGAPGQYAKHWSDGALCGGEILFGPLDPRLRGGDKFGDRSSSPQPSPVCFFFP